MDEEMIERMDELRQKMQTIEWDSKRNGVNSKQHIYDRMKEEYSELKAKAEKSD